MIKYETKLHSLVSKHRDWVILQCFRLFNIYCVGWFLPMIAVLTFLLENQVVRSSTHSPLCSLWINLLCSQLNISDDLVHQIFHISLTTSTQHFTTSHNSTLQPSTRESASYYKHKLKLEVQNFYELQITLSNLSPSLRWLMIELVNVWPISQSDTQISPADRVYWTCKYAAAELSWAGVDDRYFPPDAVWCVRVLQTSDGGAGGSDPGTLSHLLLQWYSDIVSLNTMRGTVLQLWEGVTLVRVIVMIVWQLLQQSGLASLLPAVTGV